MAQRAPLPYLSHVDRHGVRRARTRIPVAGAKPREVSLGRWGSPESRAKLRQLQEELDATVPLEGGGLGLTVADLVAGFLKHAKTHYRHADGRPTTELANYPASCRHALKRFGSTPARDFGPLALKQVRQDMIAAGWARKTVNQHVGRLKRIFKWAASEQMVPVAVFAGLQTVAGLQRGRTPAPDHPPVKPPEATALRRAYRYLKPVLRAMVHVQLLTGMRCQDVCGLSGAEIDRPGVVLDGVPIWIFRPSAHKTAWRGHSKAVAIGPKAQRILRPFLDAAGDGALFRPARPGSKPYDSHGYGQRIHDACERAGVEHWSPGQLRHAAATTIQHEYGIDGARAALGHRSHAITSVYAERDMRTAAEIARKIG